MDNTLDYFSLLDVSEDVSQAELESRYQQLAEYLTSEAIPSHLRDWARQQAALVDEAYAVLADPESRAAVGKEQARTTSNVPSGLEAGGKASDQRDSGIESRPGTGEKRRQSADSPDTAAAGLLSLFLNLSHQPLAIAVVLGLVALGGILLGLYGLPGGGGDATPPTVQDTGTLPIDTERVAELIAANEANPNDPGILFELGETFFQSNDWQSAIDWFTQLLALEPNDTHALTDVGTSNFNLGRSPEAKAAWLAVLELDPDDFQAHYNLGFLYANVEPQDLDSARREWQAVVELAPESELARTAQLHLDGLAEATATDEDADATPP